MKRVNVDNYLARKNKKQKETTEKYKQIMNNGRKAKNFDNMYNKSKNQLVEPEPKESF